MLELQKSMDIFVVNCTDNAHDKAFYFEADAMKYIERMEQDKVTLKPVINVLEMSRYVDMPDVNR